MDELLKIIIGFKASLIEKPLNLDKIKLKIKSPVVAKQEQATSLQQLEQISQNCTKCNLNQQKNRFPLGSGNPQAQLMLIGEAPKMDSNSPHDFFQDEAGQLLAKMLLAIGLKPESIYITNIVKCPTPIAHKLDVNDIISCNYIIQQQINLIKPSIICTLGKHATQALLQTDKPISQLRGQLFQLGSALLIPSFHPEYLLHSPHHKKESWEDLKLIRRKLDECS